MATAREQLYEEIIELVSKKYDDGSDKMVRDILKKYRVQTKPGVKIPADRTARDALGDRILSLWKKPPKGVEETLGSTIDEFRMQSKGRAKSTATAKKAAPRKKPAPVRGADPAPTPAPVEDERDDEDAEGDGVDVASRSGPSIEPAVRGGPRRRGKTRSECPKCKSMGVVLARSYAGDEYFSCIYCGWQAYKPVDEDDPNASLAVRLLGRSATTKK